MERDSKELVVMRQMQWERTKGEINTLICSWYSDSEGHSVKLKAAAEKFITEVESYDLII